MCFVRSARNTARLPKKQEKNIYTYTSNTKNIQASIYICLRQEKHEYGTWVNRWPLTLPTSMSLDAVEPTDDALSLAFPSTFSPEAFPSIFCPADVAALATEFSPAPEPRYLAKYVSSIRSIKTPSRWMLWSTCLLVMIVVLLVMMMLMLMMMSLIEYMLAAGNILIVFMVRYLGGFDDVVPTPPSPLYPREVLQTPWFFLVDEIHKFRYVHIICTYQRNDYSK